MLRAVSFLMVEFFWLGNSEVNILHLRPIAREAGFSSEPTWTLWRRKKCLPVPEIEPRFPGDSFRSLIIILSYPGSS
jgi:hypothetical protein